MTLFDHDEAPPPPRRRRQPITRRAVAFTLVNTLITLAIVLGGYWALSASRNIADVWNVWTYRPSSEISMLMDRTTMTDDARFLFLASTPRVESESELAGTCPSDDENVQVLGCYISADSTIHIAAVTDPELHGVEETTAAHEMLHAAWDRMSAGERGDLVPLLEAEYTRLSGNAAFVATMNLYAKSEPGARDDELHSIIGTEFTGISPALEAHYTKYFTDRATLVALDDGSPFR